MPAGYLAEGRKRRRFSISIGVSFGIEETAVAMLDAEMWIPVEVMMKYSLDCGGIRGNEQSLRELGSG